MVNMSNEVNPYEAPAYSGSWQTAAPSPQRKAAQSNLRLAIAILWIPAIYNYYCFDFAAFRNGEIPAATVFVLASRIINIGGMVAVNVLLWFFGLSLLELAAKLLHYLFSRKAKIEPWQEALYDTLGAASYFAVAGALLWLIWTVGFYNLEFGFYSISCPIGILANLLAAGLYLRLAYRWYRIEQMAQGLD
jgi:hypothetical protein